MSWWKRFDIWLEEFLMNFIPDPETDPRTLPMNLPQEPITPQIVITKPTASSLLKITALAWLGKDCTPKDVTPDRVACVETLVFLINATWPGTLSHKIVNTNDLLYAVRKSPRFKVAKDPIPGTIVISPSLPDKHGHAGVYTQPDRIASNESDSGLLKENYTRNSWRKEVMAARGLTGYLFTPVDL